MIDFRYHLVSIIAIFFALAAGIALGAGPLKAGVDQTLTDQTAALREENQGLRDQVAALEAGIDYRDSFISAVTPSLVDGRLADRRVVLVALPDADTDQVAAVGESLAQAGAAVGATVTIDPSWTDAASAQVLDTLAAELVSSGTTLPEGDGYDRGAAVLAGALVDPAGETEDTASGTDDTGDEAGDATEGGTDAPAPDETAAEGSEQAGTGSATVLAAFTEAGLIAVEGEPEPEAELAVAIAGPPPTDEIERRTGALVSLTSALDQAGAGTVAAGPPAAAAEGGVLAVIRGDGNVAELVSTVDVANQPAGRVAVVLATEQQAAGQSGHYGIVGTTDGPLPPVDVEDASP